MDGVFGEWSSWSDCTLSCGTGKTFRSRKCFGPLLGGKPCEGDFNQSQSCNVKSCPGIQSNFIFKFEAEWQSYVVDDNLYFDHYHLCDARFSFILCKKGGKPHT